MAQLLTLKGFTSTISEDYNPPIQLDPAYDYGLALLSFHSCNSIPNILKGKKFYLIDSINKTPLTIEMEEGSYEITHIEDYIKKNLPKGAAFSLKPNTTTLQCELRCDQYSIDFQPDDSLGDILGFSKKLLEPKILHRSDLPVNIVKVRTIHIDTNITGGAYYNNSPSHTIYEFAPLVNPGEEINEIQRNPIYLPVEKRNEIHNITLEVLDQNFHSVNFRGELILARLHLKRF